MDSSVMFGASQGPISAPRPQKIYIPEGTIQSAWRTTEEPYAGVRTRRSAAQKAGLAYQKKVVAYTLLPASWWTVVPGPWFAYHDDTPPRRYCQPDILLDSAEFSTVVIVEVKLRWTSDAWWQLQRLYTPVVGKALARDTIIPLCICKSYDPAVRIEEEVNLCSDLLDAKPDRFNVLVLK